MLPRQRTELSLADANAAASCLDVRAQLGQGSSWTASRYKGAAQRIIDQMGVTPDIDKDLDTRVRIGLLDQVLIRKAAQFTVDNVEAVATAWTNSYVWDYNLLPNFGEEFVAGVRRIVVEPAVERLVEATTQLQEHL